MTQDSYSNVERQQKILELVNRQQRISVADICEMFSISEATSRRDLDALTGQNEIQRVHGGAISLKQAPPEPPIFQREVDQAEVKKRIGQAAAELVHDNETIFLGSGTTVLAAARILKYRKGLTIISNSLPVLNILSNSPDITVIALGGMFRSSELSFIGHITEKALAEIRADKVIIGVHALNLEQGLTNDYLPETMTDRAILKCGREVILLADHTKINMVSMAFLAPLNSINKLITDRQAPKKFITSLKNQKIEILLV